MIVEKASLKRSTDSRSWLACSCAAIAVTVASPVWAEAPRISVSAPAGFEQLASQQTLLVDVYFGGVRRGDLSVLATPDTVKFVDASQFIDMLPELVDRQALQAALEGSALPANSDRACTPGSDHSACGRLSPENLAVILDRNKLRLDVFLNPRLLVVHENIEDRYLPAPSNQFSMINALGAVLSGGSGDAKDYQNLQDQLIIAKGAGRLRADLAYANGYGFEAERLALELDRPERRYSTGAIWAPGNELSGRRKLLGFGLETQIDTRLDKDQILGSPLAVYLDRRSRVDIVRDGRVLSSAIYDAGNQQIDTSNLPEGSYPLTLRIDEPGNPTREETRFFTKSRRIPSLGRTDYFAFAGMLISDLDAGSLQPSDDPYFQVGIAHRFSGLLALDGSVQATAHSAAAQIGATVLTPVAQFRTAALADADGGYGGIVQIASNGTSHLNYNVDFRHIVAGGGQRGHAPQAALSSPAVLPESSSARLSGPVWETYTQAGGIISYTRAEVRLLMIATYRDVKAQSSNYSVGPSMEWDVLRKGQLTVTLRGGLAATDKGTSEFAGLSVRLLGPRHSVTALAGGRNTNVRSDAAGEGLVASVAGSWAANPLGGELAVGAGYDHQPLQDDVVLTSQFDHRVGSLSGDFVRSDVSGGASSQYSVGMQTTIATGAGRVGIVGKTTTDGLIVASVSGARPQDRFELLVNEQVLRTFAGNAQLRLALPTYRAYQVRIRPSGGDLVAYDSTPRAISVYPGGVTKLSWTATPVTIKLGRLVDGNGAPIRHATLTGDGVWTETDDYGVFQIEAGEHAHLLVTTADGASFPAMLPVGEQKGDLTELGEVTCCTSGADARVSALNTSISPTTERTQ